MGIGQEHYIAHAHNQLRILIVLLVVCTKYCTDEPLRVIQSYPMVYTWIMAMTFSFAHVHSPTYVWKCVIWSNKLKTHPTGWPTLK